ncbi:MAG: glycoside hydrolase family protein [Bacteroidaceae bacterium]|nr:glycoside hydrolase family protein [Bacteroidaceae bacterium]
MNRNRAFVTILSLMAFLCCLAANSRKNVTQVTDGVVLSTAVDYHISGTTPFTTTGSIDIRHEDAVVIFDNIHPSVVRSRYMNNIFVNGEKAVNDKNAFVTIWQNGTVVFPHGNTGFSPLTVYSGKDYEGESSSAYKPYQKYSSLGQFKDNIRSFRLKRGYMVCFATGSTGKGYSRIWIAQDEDMNVPDMGRYLSGKVGFIRVVAWKAVSKKGSANADAGMLNAQSTYNWGGGDDPLSNVDYEYVAMHHHEGWTDWGALAGNQHTIHILGNNEPDNSGDDKEQYIPRSDIESRLFSNGAWAASQTTGARLGSPAPSGDISGWLVDFMNLCKKYNQRIDFVALHLYWHASGSQYADRVNWVYDLFKRPVWITEWNYGANWTDEKWPDGNRGAGTGNQAHAKAGISDIVNALENNPHLERYMIYNWVEDCRSVILNNKLTPAGEWYASKVSNMAYTGGEGYVPTWNYWAPEDLKLEYTKAKKTAKLTWHCINDKQTDSIHVERKVHGTDADYVTIKTLPMSQGPNYTYTDTLTDQCGYITYRVTNFDSDSKTRQTGEAGLTIGSAKGDDVIQYGELTISNTESVSTDFSTDFGETPEVFMGIMTNKNNKTYLTNMITSAARKNFVYQPLPWSQSGEQTVSGAETVPFMALRAGDYVFGDLDVEVGSARVKGDTTEVLFKRPFPEGTVPVVIAELKPTLKSNALMYRIWDVTNTGFKATVRYEYGLEKALLVAQTFNYLACTPGQAKINDEVMITAGIGDNGLYGTIGRLEVFRKTGKDGSVDERADTLRFVDPLIFGALQTFNMNAGAILRNTRDLTEKSDGINPEYQYGVYVKRCKDGSAPTSVKDTKDTADKFGWICLSSASGPTRIDEVSVAVSENPIRPFVINRIVYLENNEKPFELYSVNGVRVASNATQEPGIYLVRQGNKTAKVVIR